MQTTMDLSGLWEVRLGDGAPATVHLPGTLEENGLGEPETPALESRLTRRFRWEGEAVFSREVTLPDHPGRRLILEAERARQLRLTVDGQPVPTLQGTLSTPYLFELTRWAGRRVRLCLLSDNRYPGWPREEIVHASAATDETQTNWNGLLGRLCVHSVADFWVRSVRVYPHGRTLDAAVDLAVPRQALDAGGDGELVLEGPALARPFCLLRRDWQPESLRQGLCTLWCRDLPVAPEAPLWEEACGALTQITASLVLDGRTVSRARADFGLRTFGADGGRLTLNGRVFLLRGEANCCVFPETGHPPMTTGAWREVLGRYRAYGVNCLRFHSWCPPEAAFAAADELGMLLQPELSDWNCTNALETPHSAAYYEAELRQILFCYANHPSFVMLTLGNELCTGEEGHRRMAELVRLARQLDPTRRYAGSSNGQYGEQGYDGVSDFYTAAAYGDRMLRATSSPMIGHLNRCRPGTRQNYREAAAQTGGVPVFGFEVGQYESWPDFDQIDRFRGITIPENLRAIRRRAEQTGAAAYWQAGVQASGELALRCYREEVEAVLRTPGMSGLSLLGLQDFPGQGTALVGMMDAHLAPKPADFARPERFAAFFAPVVLLACFDRYTYEAGEWFTADLRVANYGRQTLAGPLCWRIAEGRTILGQGTLDAPAGWPAGGLREAGRIRWQMPGDARPHALTLELSAGDLNSRYPLWSYPCAKAAPAVLRRLTEADLRRIEAGASALIDLPADGTECPASVRCQFSTDFWSVGTFPEQEGTMGLLIRAEHPALKDYPTGTASNWQWWTQSHGRAFRLPRTIEPVVRVLDSVTRLDNLGLLWEARLGKGRLLVSGMDLAGHLEFPECRYLLECLAAYLDGPAAPMAAVTPEELRRLIRVSPR